LKVFLRFVTEISLIKRSTGLPLPGSPTAVLYLSGMMSWTVGPWSQTMAVVVVVPGACAID
jgi:hypothetical protein